jgi:hypothetical protein
LVALDDIKEGEHFPSTFKLLPSAVEKYLITQFESMLWDLMQEASDQTHNSLEPMYSTIDPTLPNFREYRNPVDDNDETRYVCRNGAYETVPTPNENTNDEWMNWAKERFNALTSASGRKAKEFLKLESKERALAKKSFLPDKRTSMITEEEIDTILSRAFEYIVSLMEFNLTILKFQINHYLLNGFKDKLLSQFFMVSTSNADWDSLVQQDPAVQNRIEELKDQIASIDDSLKDVEALQRRM